MSVDMSEEGDITVTVRTSSLTCKIKDGDGVVSQGDEKGWITRPPTVSTTCPCAENAVERSATKRKEENMPRKKD
jgi:GTP cyclohydrolase FolE2